MAHGSRAVVVPSNRLAAATTRRSSTDTGPLTQWFDLAVERRRPRLGHPGRRHAGRRAGHRRPTPSWPPTGSLAALALVSLDHSGSQACVRQAGQPCRRGLALELPADAAAATRSVLPALLAALSSPDRRGATPPRWSSRSAVTDFLQQVDPASASDRTTCDRRPPAAPPRRRTRWPASAPTPPGSTRSPPTSPRSGPWLPPRWTGRHDRQGTDLAASWQQLRPVVGLGAARRQPSARPTSAGVEADLQGQLEPDHRARPTDRHAHLGLGHGSRSASPTRSTTRCGSACTSRAPSCTSSTATTQMRHHPGRPADPPRDPGAAASVGRVPDAGDHHLTRRAGWRSPTPSSTCAPPPCPGSAWS